MFWLVGTAVLACSASPTGTATNSSASKATEWELGASDPDSFRGVGKLEVLPPNERAAYLADRQYVRSLVKVAGEAVYLNHADIRQHRFALARMRLAGKTLQNAPEAFRVLENLRAEHMAKGFKDGTFAPIKTDATTGPASQHKIDLYTLSSPTIYTSAFASRRDSLYYGYVDAAVWDSSGTPLGDMNYVEVYGNMPDGNVTSTGDQRLTQLQTYEVDSYLTETTTSSNSRDSYIVINSPTQRGPGYAIPTITAPADLVGNDNQAKICLSRTSSDCDYNLLGMWTLQIPIQGKLTIDSGAYTFDVDKIVKYATGTATDGNNNPDPGGDLYVSLTWIGGGCATQVDANNNILLPMQNFWRTVTLSADKKTLSWDMTGSRIANFSNNCQQVSPIYLTLQFTAPWVTVTGVHGQQFLTFTNNPNPPATEYYKFVPITIINSCMAAGTQIKMADGRLLPVESVKVGDRVFSPKSPHSTLTVTDTSKGTEPIPMVRILDEAGRSLLMTEMHPVHVVNKGMVVAKNLLVNDQLLTQGGSTRLVRISREQYAGNVYNLKLGAPGEVTGTVEDQTVLYANGFLVGDSQIQTKYDRLEREPKKLARKFPSQWRSDYLSSAHKAVVQ